MKKEERKKENGKEIEVVIGDDSELKISEVNDYAQKLGPNTSKEKKKVIIPTEKKNN